MNDRLRELMQELGNAINDSLSDSERIAEAIGDMRQAGYDVFLVLEATIGLNRRDDDPSEPEPDQGPKRPEPKIKLTAQDEKFLKALKIDLGGPDKK